MQSDSDAQVEAIRHFNRFYTRRIGVLEEGLLDSSFTLAQARVLFELGTRSRATAGELVEMLGLDPGYLSRILQSFVDSRLVTRERSHEDGRRSELSLTARGRKAFGAMDERSSHAVGALISPLSSVQRVRLLHAMHTVERFLSDTDATRETIATVRPYRIGDVGWAIEQHGRLYAEEFGWNGEFEALVAGLFAAFAGNHDPESEQFWVAEADGERVGCVFVVRNQKDPRTAQLRCLLVTPAGRGLGLGRRLVDQCIDFARSAGYERMLLWTNDVLVAARRIYEAAGFALVEESAHHSFGRRLVGQIWTRPL
ncbi:MAG: marR family protein [Gammaproteobacteria bacterium]|nr:marR family protein [Gammaproteobacteria bacterium]